MNQATISYRLDDLLLDVTCSDTVRSQCVKALEHYRFRALSGKDRDDEAWSVTVDVSAIGTAPDEPTKAEFVSDLLGTIAFRKSASVLFLENATIKARIEPEAKNVDVRFLTTSSSDRTAVSFGAVLLMLLELAGYHPVHAAALSDTENRCVLVASGPDARATVARRLAQGGWDVISMDAVLLSSRGNKVIVLPFVPAREQGGHHESWPDEVSESTQTAAAPAAPCLPHVLLFPFLEDAEHSRLGAVSRAEALVRLMAQCFLPELDRDLAARQMEVLSLAVHQANNFVLLAGRDLEDIPDAVRQLCEGVPRSS